MHRYRLLPVLAGALMAAAPTLAAQSLDSVTVAGMRWRNLGPANFDGRVNAIDGVGFPSKTFYVGAAGGGVWKTTNNGTTFRPLFTNEPVSPIGALVIAPSDTNVIWVGTGDPNSRNTIEPGDGIYKSTDGGLTWKMMGLKDGQMVGNIAIDPKNANVVYVAELGHAWDTKGERGLYKTIDGGNTWKRIKYIDEKTGFVDVKIDPSNPNNIYAAAWQRIRGPYYLKSGGPGSGLFHSTNGGNSWTEVKGGGFPSTEKGRITVAFARSNPSVVYALVEADSMRGKNHPILAPASDSIGAKPTQPVAQRLLSGLYRSDNGGRTWRWMNNVDTRPFYYSKLDVDPGNPNRVYFSSTPFQFSDDGGKTVRTTTGDVHVDDHAIWIDPNDGQHWLIGNDGGVAQTWDRGGNFEYLNTIPIAQFYDVSYDFDTPYNVCSGAQDNGGWCGPSARKQGPVTNAYWFTISGGDGFYTAQDPTDPNIVWGESQEGGVVRRNLKTGETGRMNKPTWQASYRVYADSILTIRGDTTQPETSAQTRELAALRAAQKTDSIALDMRFNWETPFLVSHFNPQIFYMAGNRVLKSVKRGDDLYPISPDLSTADNAKIQVSLVTTGGITNDATGAENYCTIVSLAESYLRPGWLYAGTDDGNVWMTHDDGANWEKLNGRFPGVPAGTYVSRIEPSHFDTNTFFVAFDNHRTNDFGVYLYETNDGGRTFHSIASDLPTGGPDYVHVIREDPYNKNLLFVGTSRAAYASIDGGAHWSRFMADLPTVPVYDLQIQPRDHDLIAATFGRGIWIANIAPIEQLDSKVLASNVHLFQPVTAYQYGQGPEVGASANGAGQQVFEAPSPTYGANVSYRLANSVRGGVHVIVSNVQGDTIGNLTGPGQAGIHTVTWNYQSSQRPPVAALSPSELRDSILQARKTEHVIDSLSKSGVDPKVIAELQRVAKTGDIGALFGRGRGGRGGRGGAPGGFVARPAEGPVPGGSARGGRGGGSGGAPDVMAAFPGGFRQIAELFGINRRGFGFGRGGGTTVGAGDYLVSITVDGQTQRQVLRVERTATAPDSDGGFGVDNGDHDKK
ncbi:MAG: WD40/YVTN/BNR-like repeat-containing protein [Gemmatimonadaceae bacterium]